MVHLDLLPTDTGFYTGSTPIKTQGGGGLLGIVPLIGGSGPQSEAAFPYSLGLGSQASNAVNIPLDDATPGTTVVGAPQLTMTYSGIGRADTSTPRSSTRTPDWSWAIS